MTTFYCSFSELATSSISVARFYFLEQVFLNNTFFEDKNIYNNMPPRNVPTIIEFRGKQFIIWEDIDNKFIRACKYDWYFPSEQFFSFELFFPKQSFSSHIFSH